ncbi:helix-turn-helix transcriptional regulator [Vreelandella neptunia]|uniref:AlpA family phage regulatory protein n=1 Tax=Vreelandella neptunia TaxID=115551 RepID=A0ABZ0YM19_9GAMM|nr:AlpA family phage regulatory protein [Halomonas neptunia]MDN3560869.1 AlpA family phage regulatory protein [Halomonas neptunia]WQH13180.1 AlpA family phage regulatory protein [Halomonas neptunia]
MRQMKNDYPTLIRRPEVLKRCAFSSTTLHRLIHANDFPSPVQLSERSVAWVENEVDEWIVERIKRRKG